MVVKMSRDELISKIKKEEIFPVINKEIGLAFGIHKIEDDGQNTHQFYLSYNGPLVATTAIKTVKVVDVTFNEILVTEPVPKIISESPMMSMTTSKKFMRY